MEQTLIPYPEIMQRALRTVVREALSGIRTPRDLPGDHHFYISFLTQANGVEIPASLKIQYPTEMTIVLQNRFDDLETYENFMSVGLEFNNKWEKLVIPYEALLVFQDPSVDFGLRLAPPQKPTPAAAEPEKPNEETNSGDNNVVSLADFKKKP